MPFLECRGIACRYGPIAAVEGVTFGLEPSSWTYAMGPSASGKTTLLRAIAGLQPLAAGEIRLEDRVASNERIALAPHERGIGLLFQGPSLWPHLSAAANVALGAPGSFGGRERRAEALRWLAAVGAEALGRKFPSELSGGEARAVALARVLASRPRLLLLDEPTAHLDLHLREATMERVRRFHAELHLTTLCVTHQIEPPMRVEDRVLVLERGRLVFDGPLDGLERAPQSDFMQALRRSAEKLGVA